MVPILRWSWRSLGNLSNSNRSGQPHLGGAALWLRSVNGGHTAAVAAFNTPLSRGGGVSVSLGLAVAMVRTPHRELPSEQLSAAATALHLNMYRSFDYTDRDTVYDSLALSVDGNLLDTVYEEIFASLVMRDEGGAVARVTSITHHDVTPQAPRSSRKEDKPVGVPRSGCNGRCVAGSRTGGTPTSELIDGRPCFSCKDFRRMAVY